MSAVLDPAIAGRLKRNRDGMIAAVVQQQGTGEVLMQAWMNDEALALTLATRKGTYYSRSRGQLWVKGETSGHTQEVVEVRLDCDGDTVLLTVVQTGPACHTGTRTCFDADVLLAANPDDTANPDPVNPAPANPGPVNPKEAQA
jgi:phosphoribosyl-AMP cyclohydrolase